jgi:hypothetical protein
VRNLTAEETLDLGDAIGRQAAANMLAASNPPCASTFRGARRRSQLAHELLAADSNEGGHLFQSDRGHHSNLMAAT